ncbi:unnamed protein product, partial [Ectocarpus fasciculatus]
MAPRSFKNAVLRLETTAHIRAGLLRATFVGEKSSSCRTYDRRSGIAARPQTTEKAVRGTQTPRHTAETLRPLLLGGQECPLFWEGKNVLSLRSLSHLQCARELVTLPEGNL